MNSNERDSILMDRNNLYDKLSRVLTDYEEDNCDAEDLYDILYFENVTGNRFYKLYGII